MTVLTPVKTVPLHTVASIERDVVDPAHIQKGTLYVGLEHMDSDGHLVGVQTVDEGELASSKFAFSSKHVLYGKLRPYLAKIARPDFSGVCSTDILPILPGKNLARDFLCHFLRQPRMVELATSRATGANLPRLSPNTLAEFEIALPPLPEQRRIAAILDKADELRAKRRAALTQLNNLTQAIFETMFASDSIERVTLSEVTTRITDGTHLTPRFTDAGVPFIFVKNIRNGEIDFDTDKFITDADHRVLYERCPVERDDLLYTTVGATYGHAALVGAFTRFSFQRHIAHLKPDLRKISPVFLSIVMQLPIVKKQADRWARGAAQPTINLKELREFSVPLPSLALQYEFARRVATVGNVRATQRASLEGLGALFKSLQLHMFAGEL